MKNGRKLFQIITVFCLLASVVLGGLGAAIGGSGEVSPCDFVQFLRGEQTLHQNERLYGSKPIDVPVEKDGQFGLGQAKANGAGWDGLVDLAIFRGLDETYVRAAVQALFDGGKLVTKWVGAGFFIYNDHPDFCPPPISGRSEHAASSAIAMKQVVPLLWIGAIMALGMALISILRVRHA